MIKEMKDSGVEWIGEIPTNWKKSKFKYVAQLYTGKSIKDAEKNKYIYSEDSIPYITTKDINQKFSSIDYKSNIYTKNDDFNFNFAFPGNVLMCIEGGSAGKKKVYLNQKVSFVNKLCCFKPLNVNDRFLYYFLSSDGYEKNFFVNMKGLIGGVSVNELNNMDIVFPDLLEQELISKFLDNKVSQINSIIESTQKSIDDLKKYKHSLITETVTKGLDKNIEMKDSGVKWIGEIPYNWEVISSKRLFGERKEKAYEDDIQLTASQKHGILSQEEFMKIENQGVTVVEFNRNILKHVEPADFVISMRSFQGGLEYSNIRGCISSAYVMLFAKTKIDNGYFKWLFKSKAYISALQSTSNLIRDGQALRYTNFSKVPILKIPYSQQVEISKYLDVKVDSINRLIEKKEALIMEFEQYKKTLIYEYVTGKKDV